MKVALYATLSLLSSNNIKARRDYNQQAADQFRISVHFTMNRVVVLLILIATGQCVRGVTQRLSFPIDENTNYDSICGDSKITINFRKIDLYKIKENFLTSPIMTCLDLSDTHVASVDINAFNSLPSLRYLNMSRNSFDLNDIFSKSYLNLETLILDDNRKIANPYRLRFNATYPKLKRLFVRNSISRIFFSPDSLRTAFPSLTHLYLSGSRVTKDAFDWLPNSLEYLDLTDHVLTDVTLQNLDNLQYLILSNPSGATLNLKLKNLNNLKYLTATSNMLQEVTLSTFSSLRALIFLDISNNKIKYVQSGSFDHMNNLQLLNLSSNQIESIEAGTFDRLENLEILTLEKNQISKITSPANELKLKVLYLNCNKLRSVANGTFVNMPHLENLYLHGNEISYIDQEAFSGLGKLKTLTLSNNLLSSLPFNWMLPITSIKDLDLGGNLLYDFAKLRLDASSAIANLYLSTQLKVIQSKSLDSIPKNLTINVDPNYVFSEKCAKKR